MEKIGVFFGAGAEVSYGLPTGGKFALDIFRYDQTSSKQEIKKKLLSIPENSDYAKTWLPPKYKNKKIYTFGKSDYKTIFETTLKSNKDLITEILNGFDEYVDLRFPEIGLLKIVKEKYTDKFGIKLDDYSKKITVNEKLRGEVKIFKSKYFAAMIKCVENNGSVQLKEYVISFLQLLIGATGYRLTEDINTNMFSGDDANLEFLSEITDIFGIDMVGSGQKAIELVLTAKTTNIRELYPEISVIKKLELDQLLTEICKNAMEGIFEKVIDYRNLIDSHFQYLFSPKDDWAKFTKIAVFLYTVQAYMSSIYSKLEISKKGYYDDLNEADSYGLKCEVIGTTNYTSLIKKKYVLPRTFYLNGDLEKYIEPFTGYVNSKDFFDSKSSERFLAPYLLTQSGIKPITSILVLQDYVEVYKLFKECNAIVVIGYGFNSDDSHINAIFRDLIEHQNKKIIVVDVEYKTKEELGKKLRIESDQIKKIGFIQVDRNNRLHNGKTAWLEMVQSLLNEEKVKK